MDRRSFLAQGAITLGLAVPENVFGSLRNPSDLGRLGELDAAGSDVPAEVFTEPAYVYTEESNESTSWRIGNGLLERVLKFSQAHGLYTDAFRYKVSGTDFMMRNQQRTNSWDVPARGREFIFQVDEEQFVGAAEKQSAMFNLVGSNSRDLSPSGKLLEIRLKGLHKSLDVSVFYAVYRGHPVLRKWVAIKNRGGATIRLSHLAFEALSLMSAQPDEEILRVFYGILPRELFYTGRAEDTAIVQMSPRSREGFIVMNEAPGWMKRTEMAGWGKGIQVMYDTDLFPFERNLKPGETFTSAKCGIAFFIEGRGMADPRWSIPAYGSHVLMKKGPAYRPPWLYNTWEPFLQNYNEQIILESIPVASQLGLEVFTLDAGWSRNYADNEVNAEKFPHGLTTIRKALEQRGMRLGLWEPLAVVSSESSVFRGHPEWVMVDRDGNPKTFTFPGQSADHIMCLDSPYRDSVARRIKALIRDYNLQYVKIDLTTVFNAYGKAPGCYAKSHYHKNWAESLVGIYESIKYVTEQIYQEHPNVLLDLTFELWGQKQIIDYGLLDSGDLDWMSNVYDADVTSAGPRQARMLLYQRSLAIPVDTMLIGNLRATTNSIEERFATAIGSAPLLLGDLRQLAPSQVKWYAEKISWFKDLRRSIPINESFLVLGDWMQPTCTTWDGFARLSRKGEGLIAIFKNESNIRDTRVKIITYPAGSFKVRSVMTGQSIGTFSGEQFREGIVLPIPSEYTVQIVEIRRI